MFIGWPAILASTVVLFAGFIVAQGRQSGPSPGRSQRILLHMKEYTAEIHASYMALELADRLQRSGASVTLLLELRAARIADKRVAEGIRTVPGFRPFSEIYQSFVDHGGRILVCHHCAGAAEIGEKVLRNGARLADLDDLTRAILDADKILDY